MRTDESAHTTVVDAWVSRPGGSPSAERLIHRFERAFGVVSRRAQVTLSEVTLSAVVDRVFYKSREKHPLLASIEVDGASIRCQALRERAPALPADSLVNAFRFVLVEFLAVVGSLTADTLTPALHAELAKEPPEDHPEDPHSKGTGS